MGLLEWVHVIYGVGPTLVTKSELSGRSSIYLYGVRY